MKKRALTAFERFAAHRPAPNSNGCRLWTKALSRNGYGRVEVFEGGRNRLYIAHRVAWEIERGPIPRGMQIDHLCRNRACVSVEHMEIVTPRENTHRGYGPTAKNAEKTHCPKGHPFTLTFVKGKPVRRCKECTRLSKRKGRALAAQGPGGEVK